MNVATVREAGSTHAVLIDHRGATRADTALDGEYQDTLSVVRAHSDVDLDRLTAEFPRNAFVAVDSLDFDAPYRHPRLIWGIGLNYQDHAADLAESAPADEPASFIKADHTIIGPGEPIPLPSQSDRTTSEAELGIVIGRSCRNVPPEHALDYVWGYVPILDQTAEDILQRNPRFLTRSKNFPGFFSFGPQIVGAAKVHEEQGDLSRLEVKTIKNGKVHRKNIVANMTFPPQHLISFHSAMMPLLPGDIISTGTPGAVVIHHGDVVTCEIPGIGQLSNPVRSTD